MASTKFCFSFSCGSKFKIALRLGLRDEAGAERRGAASAETPQPQRLDAVRSRSKAATARLEYKRRFIGKIGSSTAACAGLRTHVSGESSRRLDQRFVSQKQAIQAAWAAISVGQTAGDFSNPCRTIAVAKNVSCH